MYNEVKGERMKKMVEGGASFIIGIIVFVFSLGWFLDLQRALRNYESFWGSLTRFFFPSYEMAYQYSKFLNILLPILAMVGVVAMIEGAYYIYRAEQMSSQIREESKPQMEKISKPLGEGKFYCRYCGALNQKDAVYCEQCGKKIGSNPSSAL